MQISALLRPAQPPGPGRRHRDAEPLLGAAAVPAADLHGRAGRRCSQDSQFELIYTSAEDAFPAHAPRPVATDLNLRSFDIPKVTASFLRLRVLTNQCTGGPDFQGNQDNDPANVTDCDQGSIQGTRVRVSELQVFRK